MPSGMSNEHNTFALSGLKRKRVELLGLHDKLMATAKQVVADIRTVDACIRLFDPNAQAERLAINSYNKANKLGMGRSQRFVLDKLRTATRPISSREIAEAWIKDNGLEPDAVTQDIIVKRIRACLTTLRKQKLAVNEPVEGTTNKVWKIAPNL
jgi:hypothetical protein